MTATDAAANGFALMNAARRGPVLLNSLAYEIALLIVSQPDESSSNWAYAFNGASSGRLKRLSPFLTVTWVCHTFTERIESLCVHFTCDWPSLWAVGLFREH